MSPTPLPFDHSPPRQRRTQEYAWDMSLDGWLQEQFFERRIVLVAGRLADDAATGIGYSTIVRGLKELTTRVEAGSVRWPTILPC